MNLRVQFGSPKVRRGTRARAWRRIAPVWGAAGLWGWGRVTPGRQGFDPTPPNPVGLRFPYLSLAP